MHKNAVIVRAGRNSTHETWVKGQAPQFDLIVAGYEGLRDTLIKAATFYVHVPGTKVSGWSTLFKLHPEILERYERIAFLDDDLICTAEDINLAFEVGRDMRLSLWQPSLTPDSYFSYALFQQNELFKLRYVNFVEMMCPFFAVDYLKKCLPLFELGYETGIDRVWSRLHDDPRNAFAVLDCVAVAHTRPVGQNMSMQGFAGETYDDVVERLEAQFGIRFRGAVAHSGIGSNGRRLDGRAVMALTALRPLARWHERRQPKFLKMFSILVRHILTRTAETAALPAIRLTPGLGLQQDFGRLD